MISLLDILLLCRLVFRQVPQQALAAAQNIAVCPVKVIRIPRIFNIALPLGKVQQQMQLCLLLLRAQGSFFKCPHSMPIIRSAVSKSSGVICRARCSVQGTPCLTRIRRAGG